MRGVPKRGLQVGKAIWDPERPASANPRLNPPDVSIVQDDITRALASAGLSLADVVEVSSDGTPEGELYRQLMILSNAIGAASRAYKDVPADVGRAYGLSSLISASTGVIKAMKSLQTISDARNEATREAFHDFVRTVVKTLIEGAAALSELLSDIVTDPGAMQAALHAMVRDVADACHEQYEVAVNTIEHGPSKPGERVVKPRK